MLCFDYQGRRFQYHNLDDEEYMQNIISLLSAKFISKQNYLYYPDRQ